MIERTFDLTRGSGLHARPASLFVQAVQRFPDTTVFVRHGDKEVNGRSLLAVLSLGAGAGATIRVRCEGPQAAEAMEALSRLLTGDVTE